MSVPLAEQGDPNKLASISGRIAGAHAGQQIVLYARTDGWWWVQPYFDHPFTKIQPDSTWKNSTHPGLEYAALLVAPEFRAPGKTDVLPTEGVIAKAVTPGTPLVWKRWWFVTSCSFVVLAGAYAIYRLRLNQVREMLRMRFEERLAERMRVAQILHDTLLQGVISSSMQLHVAVEQLPADSPIHQTLDRVLRSMSQVIEEGRTTLQGLRSAGNDVHDLRQALARIPQEFNFDENVGFRVTVTGTVLSLQPRICLDLHCIAREVFINSYRDSKATNIEMQLRYTAKNVGLIIRQDGQSMNAKTLSSIQRRAQKMGASLKLRRRMLGKAQLEVRVPGTVAFESIRQRHASGWFRRFHG